MDEWYIKYIDTDYRSDILIWHSDYETIRTTLYRLAEFFSRYIKTECKLILGHKHEELGYVRGVLIKERSYRNLSKEELNEI